MAEGSSVTLPHGAKGFELDDFAIEFRPDTGKIVGIRKSTGEHYTLHFGGDSGVLDVHRTWTDGAGHVRHQTLFALRRDDLVPLLEEFHWLVPRLWRIVRRLPLGWLHHRDISIVRGLDPITDEDIAAITRKRRQRLVLDEDKLKDGIVVPEYLDDVWEFPDGAFSLFHRNRRMGVGIKATDRDGNVHLVWIKLRDLLRFADQAEDDVINTVMRYAIPKQEFGNYPVLEQ